MPADVQLRDADGTPLPPVAFIDRLDTLSCREEYGGVRHLVRKARVINLYNTDYNVLWDSLEAVGIPTVPSTLDGDGWEMLRLCDRSAALVDEDSGTVDVTLEYRHVLDGCQEFAANTVVYGRVHASLSQGPTNFYVDWTNPENPILVQITVSHTFPKITIPLLGGFGSLLLPADPDYAGQTLTQGGEVQVMMPQKTFVVEGLMFTRFPWVVEQGLIDCLNDDVWFGGNARTWLCTDVQYEAILSDRYKFRIEWQYNEDTWDPDVVFIDKRTGQPPPNLIKGTGYKSVPWNLGVDFMDVFPEGMEFAESSTRPDLRSISVPRAFDKPDDFRRGDRKISARDLNKLKQSIQRQLIGGQPLNVQQFGDRQTVRYDEEPIIPNSEIQTFYVMYELDDYLLCYPIMYGYNAQPNMYNGNPLTVPGIIPNQNTLIAVAKPWILQRTPWDGKVVEVSGVLYQYHYISVGVRQEITLGGSGGGSGSSSSVTTEIDVPYFVGDIITARRGASGYFVDINGDPIVNPGGSGAGIDSAPGPDGYAIAVVWNDLNVQAREWESSGVDDSRCSTPIRLVTNICLAHSSGSGVGLSSGFDSDAAGIVVEYRMYHPDTCVLDPPFCVTNPTDCCKECSCGATAFIVTGLGFTGSFVGFDCLADSSPYGCCPDGLPYVIAATFTGGPFDGKVINLYYGGIASPIYDVPLAGPYQGFLVIPVTGCYQHGAVDPTSCPITEALLEVRYNPCVTGPSTTGSLVLDLIAGDETLTCGEGAPFLTYGVCNIGNYNNAAFTPNGTVVCSPFSNTLTDVFMGPNPITSSPLIWGSCFCSGTSPCSQFSFACYPGGEAHFQDPFTVSFAAASGEDGFNGVFLLRWNGTEWDFGCPGGDGISVSLGEDCISTITYTTAAGDTAIYKVDMTSGCCGTFTATLYSTTAPDDVPDTITIQGIGCPEGGGGGGGGGGSGTDTGSGGIGGGGGGGIASSRLGTASGTSGTATKPGVEVDAGMVLVVVAGCTDDRTVTSVTFNGIALTPAIVEVLGVDCEIWYLRVTSNTSGSIVANTTAGLIQFTAREVSGMALNVLDQTSGDISNIGGDPPLTGPTDPTIHTNEFALAGAMYIGSVVPGASWTGTNGSEYIDGQSISTTVGSITYTLVEGWQILSHLGATPAGTYDTIGGGVRPPSWAACEATFA